MASYLYSVNVIIAGIFITCSQVKFTFQKDVPYLVKDGGSNEDEIFTSLNKRQISNLSSAPFRTNGKIDITTTKYINIPQDSENVIIRNHGYYTSKVMTKTPDFNEYWNDLKNTKGYMTLIRGSYPISMKADLKFKFRFYGNNITKIILTSSGFLYMGQFIHNNLQDTQYTAPLMAMFEAEDSNILYKDFGDKFVLEWQDVYLPDKNDTKPFHFQTTLHANGTIYFAYKQVPVDLFDIDMKNHPVKVGLSDAYYIDVIAGGVIRRTVHEYNRIDIDFKLVRTGTVVILDPLKTCNIAKDCTTCLTQEDSFHCKWCPITGRCSDGFDWLTQKWREQACARKAFDDSAKCSSSPKQCFLHRICIIAVQFFYLIFYHRRFF